MAISNPNRLTLSMTYLLVFAFFTNRYRRLYLNIIASESIMYTIINSIVTGSIFIGKWGALPLRDDGEATAVSQPAALH